MAWLPISGTLPQYSTASNELANDYYLKFYASGTTTPINMATDSTGGTTLAQCALSAEGFPITNPLDDTTRFIPHIDQDYRIVLYTNETDADNNTTANALFNIDGMALQVIPTGDAANITLRDATIEAQDDYDRSPLFTDGDGFTAGAGPHIITVPSGWVPSNADMRFYRVDNSGIITALTPTATTSTTFTLAETLLSTDTIFIGGDDFRNIFEGDPEANFEAIKQSATTTSSGVIEKATAEETAAGENDKFPDSEEIKNEYCQTTTLTTSSGLTSGSCLVVRSGRQVVITGDFGHSSASSANSANSYLPSWATPSKDHHNVYFINSGRIDLVTVNSSGRLSFTHRDSSFASVSVTTTEDFTIAYTVD